MKFLGTYFLSLIRLIMSAIPNKIPANGDVEMIVANPISNDS